MPIDRLGPGQLLQQQRIPATTSGRIIVVGPQESVRSIQEAARIARDGDTIEIRSGE
jgi:hypothetical protein